VAGRVGIRNHHTGPRPVEPSERSFDRIDAGPDRLEVDLPGATVGRQASQRRHLSERTPPIHEDLAALNPAAGRRKGRAEQRERQVPRPQAGQDLRPDVPAQGRINLLEQPRRLGRPERLRRGGRPADGDPPTQPSSIGVHGDHIHQVNRPDHDRSRR
jgi:hypothetical protein